MISILVSLVTKVHGDKIQTLEATGTPAVKSNLAGLVTININKTNNFETTFAFLNIIMTITILTNLYP